MKMIHSGQKGLTLIELLIVIAILGIIAAVIIPNISGFLVSGTLAAANTEAENVKTASLGFFTEQGVWPDSTATGNFSIYIAGTLKASYAFDDDGFIVDASNPGGDGTGTAGVSTEYSGIHFAASNTTGHGTWVRG
jgi:prepilin-type N-terminal cleavage/methylation domain-containing protein